MDTRATDVEIFSGLPLGDCWDGAELVLCFRYLRSKDDLVVPPCWESALNSFEAELAIATAA